MKFIVSSSTLLKQLQVVGGVVSTNNTLPILDNFLFDITENKLTISASDLETTMTSQVEISGKEVGAVAVPAKILLEILKTFPDQPLTFQIDENTNSIEMSSDQGKYKLAGYDGDEFPKIPSVDNTGALTMKSKILLKAINKTLFATGNDELRPVLSGIYCEISKGSLSFVATDAQRLVKYTRRDIEVDSEASMVLPKKPLTLLRNVLPEDDGDIKIAYNESNAFFTFGDTSLVCRLVDGKYPNYEAVIPSDNPNKLVISCQDLLNSIKRVAIFSNKSTYLVRLKISGSELNISAEDLDFSTEAKERRTCQYDGEDIEIGFNAKYLTDMLANVDGEEIIFEMSTPSRAGILLPVDDKKSKDEDTLMLIMPIMLNG